MLENTYFLKNYQLCDICQTISCDLLQPLPLTQCVIISVTNNPVFLIESIDRKGGTSGKSYCRVQTGQKYDNTNKLQLSQE